MKVGIDVDGVLADFTYSFTELMKSTINPDVVLKTGYEQLTWNEYDKASESEVKATWEWIDQNPWWWKNLHVMISESERILLWNLCRQHEVFFITNRHERTSQATHNWIEENILCCGDRNESWFRANIIHTDDKAQTCRDEGIQIIIEDSPKNLIRIFDAQLDTEVVRMWRPYNANVAIFGLATVGNFADFYQIVQLYAEHGQDGNAAPC